MPALTVARRLYRRRAIQAFAPLTVIARACERRTRSGGLWIGYCRPRRGAHAFTGWWRYWRESFRRGGLWRDRALRASAPNPKFAHLVLQERLRTSVQEGH